MDPEDHYLRDVVVQGCPEWIVDTLQRLEEAVPLRHLLLSPRSEKTFGLFTHRVLHHIAQTSIALGGRTTISATSTWIGCVTA